MRGPILSFTDKLSVDSSAPDGWPNLERISNGDFRSLHIARLVLARMSSGTADEPPPKGHAKSRCSKSSSFPVL